MKRMLFVLALAALGGCGYFHPTTTVPAPGPSVLVIGDSNIALVGNEAPGAWAPEYTATVTGLGGWRITSAWAPIVRADVARCAPTAVVVQLGTNDYGIDLQVVPQGIDAIMAEIPAGTPVYWNNVATNPDVNPLLADATTRWPNLHVVDFVGTIAAHPEYLPGPDPHLSPAGVQAYIAWTKSYL